MKRTPRPRSPHLRTALVAVLVAGAALLLAGPLDPPGGPVAPTYKTLAEVEPRTPINAANTPGDADSLFKITQPGSYYLAGNITGVAAKHGIEIAASGVTLDFCGFTMQGVAGSLDGVSATAPNLGRIVVRNGSIRNWGDIGVDLATQPTSDCLAEDLTLTSNTKDGLALRDASIAQRCVASNNGGSGLAAAISCTLSDCTVSYNGVSGISTGVGAVVRQCTAYSNVEAGIAVGQSSTLTGCSSYSNLTWGYLTDAGCSLTASTANSNGDGFYVGDGCVVTGCTAESNGNNGFFIGNGGTIQQSTARNNGQVGIYLGARCLALSNSSMLNGGGGGGGSVGIATAAFGNRIEGNVCTANHYGILVSGTNNILVRNSCSANTVNWSLGSNNVFGPIVDRRSPGSGSVSGNSATSTLGTTDPNANFSY